MPRRLLLAFAPLLLAFACATAPPAEDANPDAPPDPLAGYRLGRVGWLHNAWIVLPEDDDDAVLCLDDPRAAPFRQLGARVKFDGQAGEPPQDPKACTPLLLQRIDFAPEGALRDPKPADKPKPPPPEADEK